MPYATPSTTQPGKQVEKRIADAITNQAVRQLQASRQHKRARMDQIKENENLYHGIIEKSIRNPFNECFPFMAGFVDHMRAKIEDDSTLLFTYQAESDLKRAAKINGFYEEESTSPTANASWNIKHRHAKVNAIFSGVAIYHYYAEKNPEYRSCLEVVSHYDFHCEPRGGPMVENHLFCGTDNLFKNKEDILENTSYDKTQAELLVKSYNDNGYKDNDDYDYIRNNRYHAMAQDPQTNNYVGQTVIKLVQFYTTYKNVRYYVLFNEQTSTWIRCCLMTDLFPDDLYPYVAWHTNEDPDLFWSKAPCDDARPVAKIINTMINQELYNRQKRNYGQRAYDAEMFPNVAALADFRPDGLVPVDTKMGTRNIAAGVYEFKVGDLNGTLDLVTWLDQFTGKQIGNTSSGQGQAEKDKKVGVFQGEIAQEERLIGVKNKSFRDALSRIGLLFKQGLDHNLSTARAVKIMGGKGIEWHEFSPEDLKTERPLTITPIGGTSEQLLKRAREKEQAAALLPLQAVNPQWKERKMLLLNGYTEEDVKEAFSPDTFAQKELLSEAAEAEKIIVEGGEPAINRGADSNYMQHIIDFATDTNDLSDEMYVKLMDFAMAHVDIAVENEARNIKEMIRNKKIAMAGQGVATPPNTGAPTPGNAPVIPTPAIPQGPMI